MYRLEITASAGRGLARLAQRISDSDFQRLIEAIANLADEPHPKGVIKLKARESTYRIRAGKYGVVYQIRDKELLVLVVQVNRRKESTYNF